jgi:hypothetical protein
MEGVASRTVRASFAADALFLHDGLRSWTVWSSTRGGWRDQLAVVLRLADTDVESLHFADPCDAQRFHALVAPDGPDLRPC